MDPYIERAQANARNDLGRGLGLSLGGAANQTRVWTAATGEPRAVIEAITRLNEAVHLARRAGWEIRLNLHNPLPEEEAAGPHREVRATITREV